MNKFDILSEFPEVSAKQWKQKIQYDLKGADYNETLIWKSLDGIHVKPFYHPDDAPAAYKVNSPEEWNITQQIYVSTAERANKKARQALEKGAEAIWFILPSEEIELNTLFEKIDLLHVPVYLKPAFHSSGFVKKLNSFLQEGSRVYLQMDIVGNLAKSGNWYGNLQADHELMDEALENSGNIASVLSIDVGLYQNAGANIPQQLAYALALLNEYLNHLEEKQFSEEKRKKLKIQFLVSIGPNYFFEIAKLRALRLLFRSLSKEYGISAECHILSQPTRRNKTLYDYNVNLLRTTTESMSAILGGTNSICNMAYDSVYHKNNEFGDRIARNQLLVLKHEAYFEKVANPSEGSYYIETLTHDLSAKALEIFKQIENGGGFLQQLKEGIIQKKIAESAEKEQEEFDSGRLILVGTNKYPNPADRMKNELELYPFLKQKPRKTLIPPILERRLSEKTEQERLSKEEELTKEA